MKRVFTLLAIGLLIFGASVGSAHAFSLGGYTGPILIHVSGLEDTSIYLGGTLCDEFAAPGSCSAAALPVGTPIPGGTAGVTAGGFVAGEDAWGVFRVNNITDLALNELYNPTASGEEMTGIFYNVFDYRVFPGGLGTQIRSIGAGLGPAILADIYLDTTPDASTAGGPLARAGAGVYPTYTDGSLFLSVAFVPGADALDPVAQLAGDFDPTTSKGSAVAFANATGGSFMSSIAPGQLLTNIGTFADIRLEFDVKPVVPAGACGAGNPGCFGASPWTVQFNDPVEVLVPEPSSLLLLGSALLALGGIGLLRRRD